MHLDSNRIPRWLVESDPSWERSIDSDVAMLKWTKKGTKIQAVCHPTSMICDIIGHAGQAADLSDLVGSAGIDKHAALLSGLNDITKYLSSRYLNPSINGVPEFDLKKFPKW